jgi:hypothetical protein
MLFDGLNFRERETPVPGQKGLFPRRFYSYYVQPVIFARIRSFAARPPKVGDRHLGDRREKALYAALVHIDKQAAVECNPLP